MVPKTVVFESANSMFVFIWLYGLWVYLCPRSVAGQLGTQAIVGRSLEPVFSRVYPKEINTPNGWGSGMVKKLLYVVACPWGLQADFLPRFVVFEAIARGIAPSRLTMNLRMINPDGRI